MASNVFNFPGFFDREIDASFEEQSPIGVPAGIVGTAERGPAFIPTTVGSFPDFKSKFGTLNSNYVSTYAVERHLENRTALTFVRVLGAGSNTSASDIETTRVEGTVKNAGFKISGSLTSSLQGEGSVQFLIAKHTITGSEAFSQLGFTRNDSLFQEDSFAYLTRAMIFCASGSRVYLIQNNKYFNNAEDSTVYSTLSAIPFKIAITSTDPDFGYVDGESGLRVFTASLDPTDENYLSKILNTDPTKFSEEKHLLYADFPIDREVAYVDHLGNVSIVSGSTNTSSGSGDPTLPWFHAFGRFDTRYKTPKTTNFISQPFGTNEYDLFHIESLDDGAYANNKYKISILNIKKSSNPRYKFGTFSLIVRAYDDTDTAPVILEQYSELSLDPEASNYVARVIGDRKAFYNFDAEAESDRRIIVQGNYPNRSKFIRVVMNDSVEKKLIPEECLPFGFRGLEAPAFNQTLISNGTSIPTASYKMASNVDYSSATQKKLLNPLVPPVPYRFKVTRGAISTDSGLEGKPGPLEITDNRYFWGIKMNRNTNVLNANITDKRNTLIDSYAKFLGIDKLDVMVTGADGKDTLHNHKFTLAKVAFGNGAIADLTSSAEIHMKEAAYLRNGTPDVTNYKILDSDGSTERITLASLINNGTTAAVFNAYSAYAKFTTILQGGFDGLNILDKNAVTMNDRASSTESRTDGIYGNANGNFVSPGFDYNQNGTGTTNNAINSYRVAANIITDPIASNVNVIAFPGQREPLVTDYVSDKVRDFGLAIYTMDIPVYNPDGNRVFDGQTGEFIDPEYTSNNLESRALDNEYVAAYFPNVVIDDAVNNKRVTVPGSIAAVSALSFNDKVAYPWFAPAGFNRAALDFVKQTSTRIKQDERERLFDVHVNPIVKFPREGFVIFSQNTLEQAESALGSVNVVRMLNDIKRQIIDIGNRLIFEQLTPELRQQFVKQVTPVLSAVQIRQGIESFRVICDLTNNTDADVEANRMNARILIKPTRAVEFVAVDFIITNSGVSFA